MKPEVAQHCAVARVFDSGCMWVAVGRDPTHDGFGYGYGTSEAEAVGDCTKQGLGQCTRIKPERTCAR